MTARRDSKGKPKADKKPEVKKETLRDLEAKDGENVKAGQARLDSERITCTCNCR